MTGINQPILGGPWSFLTYLSNNSAPKFLFGVNHNKMIEKIRVRETEREKTWGALILLVVMKG